jgi:hypothetical protein
MKVIKNVLYVIVRLNVTSDDIEHMYHLKMMVSIVIGTI